MTSLRQRALVLASVLVVAILCVSATPALAQSETTFVYEVVKRYCKGNDVQKLLTPGDGVEDAGDGIHAYIVKKVTVRDEAHLLALMGVSDPSRLSDTQKGLLASYRTANSEALHSLEQYAPPGKRTLTVKLVDTSACTDTTKFPNVREDFWPKAERWVNSTSGGKVNADYTITVSGVDVAGFGAQAATEMKYTMAHEFGHTLALTAVEANPYGPDGHHWNNEVITERAAFSEGWANFITMQLYPERVRTFRSSLSRVRVETPQGYKFFEPTDPAFMAADLLKVEAVQSLLLNRMASELPDGRAKVFAAFAASNSGRNSLSGLLQKFVQQNPGDAAALATMLDEETCKRLSNDELRAVLGNSLEIEVFLRNRADPTARPQTANPPAVKPTLTPAKIPGVTTMNTGGTTIYKWKDKDGKWHFTDTPPPVGVSESNVRSDKKGPAVKVNGTSANPFGM